MRHDRPEETRRALLDAGRRLIVERQGHEIPSTVDICAHAGLSRGALYARFADREHYVEELLGEILDALFLLLSRPMIGGPVEPDKTIAEFMAAALDAETRAKADLSGAYLAVLGAVDTHEGVRSRHALVMHALIDHLEEAVLRGQASGAFRSSLSGRDLAALLALAASSAILWTDLGFDLDRDGLMKGAARLLES